MEEQKTLNEIGVQNSGNEKVQSSEEIFLKAEEITEDELAPIDEISEEETSGINDEAELITEDFVPIVMDKSQQQLEEENGVKKEMDGKILTVKEVTILPPKTKKLVEGNIEKIPPSKTTTTGAEYYSSKLRIRFEEENIVEYYPTVRFWVNEGQVNSVVKLDRDGHSKVSQLVRMILQKMSGGAFELEEAIVNERPTIVVTKETEQKYKEFSKKVSDKEILDFLVGKKVEIKTARGNYNGQEWFRNDIKRIL